MVGRPTISCLGDNERILFPCLNIDRLPYVATHLLSQRIGNHSAPRNDDAGVNKGMLQTGRKTMRYSILGVVLPKTDRLAG